MFNLRSSLRNFETKVRLSFLGVKTDFENLSKANIENKKIIDQTKSDTISLKNDLKFIKETFNDRLETLNNELADTNKDLEKTLKNLTKDIITLKEGYVESLTDLHKELSETKKAIELKMETNKEAKSEFKSDLKLVNKKITDLEDQVKVLKPQEEVSVEKIFKEETKTGNFKIIIGIAVIVIIIALIVYGLISTGVI